MNHQDVEQMVAAIMPDPYLARYMFAWVQDERPSAVYVSLLPQPDGGVIALHGDLRDGVAPWLDQDGGPLIFRDEDSACRWAWETIRTARSEMPAPPTADERERALESGREGVRLFREIVEARRPSTGQDASPTADLDDALVDYVWPRHDSSLPGRHLQAVDPALLPAVEAVIAELDALRPDASAADLHAWADREARSLAAQSGGRIGEPGIVALRALLSFTWR